VLVIPPTSMEAIIASDTTIAVRRPALLSGARHLVVCRRASRRTVVLAEEPLMFACSSSPRTAKVQRSRVCHRQDDDGPVIAASHCRCTTPAGPTSMGEAKVGTPGARFFLEAHSSAVRISAGNVTPPSGNERPRSVHRLQPAPTSDGAGPRCLAAVVVPGWEQERLAPRVPTFAPCIDRHGVGVVQLRGGGDHAIVVTESRPAYRRRTTRSPGPPHPCQPH